MDEKGGIFLSRESRKCLEYILSHYLELPKEFVLDLPRITIVGDVQVLVENHRGIIEYTPEKLRVSTSIGELQIEGMGLALRCIQPDEIGVDGKIRSVTLLE